MEREKRVKRRVCVSVMILYSVLKDQEDEEDGKKKNVSGLDMDWKEREENREIVIPFFLQDLNVIKLCLCLYSNGGKRKKQMKSHGFGFGHSGSDSKWRKCKSFKQREREREKNVSQKECK